MPVLAEGLSYAFCSLSRAPPEHGLANYFVAMETGTLPWPEAECTGK